MFPPSRFLPEGIFFVVKMGQQRLINIRTDTIRIFVPYPTHPFGIFLPHLTHNHIQHLEKYKCIHKDLNGKCFTFFIVCKLCTLHCDLMLITSNHVVQNSIYAYLWLVLIFSIIRSCCIHFFPDHHLCLIFSNWQVYYVSLTLAKLRIFSKPFNVLLWDEGHYTYRV